MQSLRVLFLLLFTTLITACHSDRPETTPASDVQTGTARGCYECALTAFEADSVLVGEQLVQQAIRLAAGEDDLQWCNKTKAQLRKEIRDTQRKMQLAAKEMDFLAAAKYRDQIRAMQKALENARGN
jgi:protein-arginine kinase activator protein McsA